MARRYGAFLVRCWRLGEGAQRVEIAHIQSGERARPAALAALAWTAAHHGEAAGEQATADRIGAVRGREGTGGHPANTSGN